MLHASAFAQPFIKAFGDNTYGTSVRILPTADNGWMIFTMDSLVMTKFSNCGIPEWSKRYPLPNQHVSLTDIIKTSDEGFAVLTMYKYNNNQSVALITKLDYQGNLQWSKSYEDGIYRHWPYSINEDQQGNLLIYMNVENIQDNNVYNVINKVNSNGTYISTNFYDHGWVWGGAIITSDSGMLIRTGNTLIKTNNAGIIQWDTDFTGSNYFKAPLEVSDGYILTGYTNPGNMVSFMKFDLQGNLLWGGLKVSSIPGNPPSLHKKNNGNFCAVFAKTIIEFDKDLNVIKQTSIQSNMGLTGTKLCFLTDGTPVLAGYRALSSDLFYAKLDDDYRTNCDTVPAPIPFTPASSTLINLSLNRSVYNFNEVYHVFTPDTLTTKVELICKRNLYLGDDLLFCNPSDVTLQNTHLETFESFLWSTSETTQAITVNRSDKYWLQVTYNCGVDSLADSVNVVFVTPIVLDLGADVYACENETHVFNAPPCDSCSYLWNTGNSGDTIVVQIPGNYWLNITDSSGCVYSDTVNFFNSKCECQLYFPNSFTPNSDGLNESFQPYYYCDLFDYRLKIFNRWGEPVFSTQNSMDGWNGRQKNTIVPIGTYIYTATYTPILKGKVEKPITRTGFVTVIY